MRFIFSIIKNFIAVLAIIVIIYIVLKYAPFLREQEWNPLNHSPDYVQQGLDNSHNPTNVPPAQPEQGESYSLKNNDIIRFRPTIFKYITYCSSNKMNWITNRPLA